MEKFLKAVDLADHPEKYTAEEIRLILEDAEIREAYNALCDSDSALNLPTELSSDEIDREWERFDKTLKAEKRKGFRWINHFSRRAAVIGGVVTISLVAMAIGGVILSKHDDSPAEKISVESTVMAPTVTTTVAIASDTVATEEPIRPVAEAKVFENETLTNILDEMSRHYGFKVRILNGGVAGLRLYFRWDPSDDLADVVRQLNNFERINIVLSDNTLTVK
ncbi:MAG: DUF4974 domain-containing protein [Muribaculaceae bacterium]|nr:DUF4974 domain-containing protein [Muribaculaceae bacterium]